MRTGSTSPPLTLLALTVLCLLVLGCGGGPADSETGPPGPIEVVATTGMIGDTAARIAGEHAVVQTLMGPGVDPHLYEASEGAIRKLTDADLILYNGLHLKGKMGDVLVKIARQRPVVAVSETVPDEQLREPVSRTSTGSWT